MKHRALVFVACLMATTAQAQAPEPRADAEREPARTADTAPPDAEPAKADDTPRLSDARCIRKTGSRIRERDTRTPCNGQPGRSYTKDDLDRTGHTNLADALRTLDPAVQ